jgi:hypothetical protein
MASLVGDGSRGRGPSPSGVTCWQTVLTSIYLSETYVHEIIYLILISSENK